MIKRLIIHLGDCKTGSTSIQSILANKAWKSTLPFDTQIEYPCVFNHLRLVKSLGSKKLSDQQEKLFLNIGKRFEKSKADVGVLSAEQFEFLDPYLLDQALKKYLPSLLDKLTLIAYIRPHADRLLASYTERIKKGAFRGTLEQFYQLFTEKKILDYAPRIAKWRSIFGDKYLIKPFASSLLKQNDVVNDFFFTIFNNEEFQFLLPTRHNESVSVEDLAVLRYVQILLKESNPSSEGNARLGAMLAKIMAKNTTNKRAKLKLHQSIANKMMSHCMDDAKSVDVNYFKSSILQDSLNTSCFNSSSNPQPLDIASYYDESSVRMINCWIELYQTLIAQDPKYFLKVTQMHGKI